MEFRKEITFMTSSFNGYLKQWVFCLEIRLMREEFSKAIGYGYSRLKYILANAFWLVLSFHGSLSLALKPFLGLPGSPAEFTFSGW